MKNIRPHPKHGVNPTIPTCFWCGESKNEIALLGRAFKDAAPMNMVLDYGPCEACQRSMAHGITLIEAGTPESVGHPAMAKAGALSQVAPTGRWLVIKQTAIEGWITNRDLLNHILTTRKAFLERDMFEQVLKDAQ